MCLAAGTAAILAASCSKDHRQMEPPPPDTISPAAVRDLRIAGTQAARPLPEAASDSVALLIWTAPGDDSTDGTATRYDARFAADSISDSSWAEAVAVEIIPAPKPGGETESLRVEGLAPETTYGFALKAADDAQGWSGLSNVAIRRESVPPGGVIDLQSGTQTDSSITLTWTAPGDDRLSGTAAVYDVRYARHTLTTFTWDSAAVAASPPIPQPAGGRESMTVNGLQADADYWFALRTADEARNWSMLSNVLRTKTKSGDRIAPAAVTDLSVTAQTATTLHLEWTAPGNDGAQGTASHYEIRLSTAPITEGNWDSALAVRESLPCRAAGLAESVDLGCLEPNATYHVALKTADEVPNWSTISNVAFGVTEQVAWPHALSLGLFVGRDARIGGRLCLKGDGYIGGAATGVDGTGEPTIICGGCTSLGPGRDAPAIYTDPDHFPGATYYYVRITMEGQRFHSVIHDRNGVDITGDNSLDDLMSYSSSTRTFEFRFNTSALITRYFDDATGVFHRAPGDQSVVVNFGEAPIADPPGGDGVTSISLGGAGMVVRATIVNTRFVGVGESARLDPSAWKGGGISVKSVTFEPRNGLAIVGHVMQKFGSSSTVLGTTASPALVYLTRDAVELQLSFAVTGCMICLRDFKSTGGPSFEYAPGFIALLPAYLRGGAGRP
jgi:chitodextrinase